MEPPSPYSIPITNESGTRIRTSLLRSAVRAALGRHQAKPGRLAIQLTNDAAIRSMNRTFRGIDEATDVLTFPATPIAVRSSRIPNMHGDIAISVEYAGRQALLRNASLDDEIAYLGIHGALHICGFDDVETKDRRAMQIAMAELGEHLGLAPDPEWTSLLHAVVSVEAGR